VITDWGIPQAKERQREALEAYWEARTEANRRRVAEAFLPLVEVVAKRCCPPRSPMSLEEGRQYGVLGLMAGINRLKPSPASSAASYLTTAIRLGIVDGIRLVRRSLRVTSCQWTEDRKERLQPFGEESIDLYARLGELRDLLLQADPRMSRVLELRLRGVTLKEMEREMRTSAHQVWMLVTDLKKIFQECV
jgi:RNA polymerase sigma factor (sigma-70 family)